MKKLLLMLFIATITILTSCTKAGEIEQRSPIELQINNKIYKLVDVVPCNNCRSIWIMYPKDSTNSVPTALNWTTTQSNGKSTYTVDHTLIKID